MRLFFFYILTLYVSFIFSQRNHVVINFSTKKSIPYATISYPKNNKGFYSNNKGEFQFSKIVNDSIYISALGYKVFKTDIPSLKDTIFLHQQTILLNEITINTTSFKEKEIGFKAKSHYWFGAKHFDLGVIIKPTEKNRGYFIHEILLPVKKKIPNSKKRYNNFKSILRVGVYSIKNNLPDKNCLKKPITINFNQDSPEIIKIDLSDENIKLTKQGLFLSATLVGEVNDKKEVIIENEIPLPGIICTNKKTKDFSYVKAFYKLKFSNDWNKLTYEKLMMKKPVYPAFRLVIRKYEN